MRIEYFIEDLFLNNTVIITWTTTEVIFWYSINLIAQDHIIFIH